MSAAIPVSPLHLNSYSICVLLRQGGEYDEFEQCLADAANFPETLSRPPLSSCMVDIANLANVIEDVESGERQVVGARARQSPQAVDGRGVQREGEVGERVVVPEHVGPPAQGGPPALPHPVHGFHVLGLLLMQAGVPISATIGGVLLSQCLTCPGCAVPPYGERRVPQSAANPGSALRIWSDDGANPECCHYGGGLSFGPGGAHLHRHRRQDEMNASSVQDPRSTNSKIHRFGRTGADRDRADNWALGLRTRSG